MSGINVGLRYDLDHDRILETVAVNVSMPNEKLWTIPAERRKNRYDVTEPHIVPLADLHVELLGRGVAWLDTGTHKSLLEAGAFIETIETRQGLKVACLEEIAYTKGFINKDQLSNLITEYPKNDYTEYLQSIIDN